MLLGTRLLLATVLLSTLTACTKASDDKAKDKLPGPPLSGPQDKNPTPKAPDTGKQTCVPESALLGTSISSAGIVGGTRIYPNDIDAKRVVLLYSEGSICTATPIADDVLLTAAHCADGLATKSWVAFHTSISCESGFNAENPEMTIKVKEFVVNENYNSKVGAALAVGDVALVFLDRKIPTSYPTYKIANPNDVTGDASLNFFGYGVVGYQKKGSGILRKMQLSRDLFRIDGDAKKVVLDQSKGRGVCSGDSGGPGLVMINGEYQILGVNSYVSSRTSNGSVATDACQGTGYLALADSYLDWIEVKMAARNRALKQ